MATITRIARLQIERLSDHYLLIDRPEALRNLSMAINEAREEIDNPRELRRKYPSIYKELAPLGMTWIKVHAYWFGYRTMPSGEGAIGNVIWQSANIPSRVEPFDGRQ